jgi:N-acetylglucosamine kinase-like BadF-type ATPase
MIAVAESGSTKCDWLIADDQGRVVETHTMGFNPFFHTSDVVYENLGKNEVLLEYLPQIEAVYFYGAGCSSPERNEIISKGLHQFFTNARCQVRHDLDAAAYATYTGQAAITCILGTGSNSCYYDGEAVSERVPALGYILGDEGSGAYFGKQLVADYIYNRLPEPLQDQFKETYNLSKEDIFHKVYNTDSANVFLASFMKFMVPHKEHKYVSDMVYAGFSKFAEIHILCFPSYKEVPVNFVGSVAFYFEDILKKVAAENGFTVGIIDKNPAISLLNYHLKTSNKSKDFVQS